MKNDWNPEDASGGTVLDNLTRDRLEELESAPRTPMRLFCDYLICFLPVLAGCLALAEYLWVPNLKGNRSTSTYAYFLAVLILASLAFFAAAFRPGASSIVSAARRPSTPSSSSSSRGTTS